MSRFVFWGIKLMQAYNSVIDKRIARLQRKIAYYKKKKKENKEWKQKWINRLMEEYSVIEEDEKWH